MLSGFLLFSDRRTLREDAVGRMRQAFRPGTRANQRSHVMLFIAFALHFGMRNFPAGVGTLVCFGEFFTCSFRAPKSVTNALALVRAFHLLQGFSTAAFDDTRLAHTLKGRSPYHWPGNGSRFTWVYWGMPALASRCIRSGAALAQGCLRARLPFGSTD